MDYDLPMPQAPKRRKLKPLFFRILLNISVPFLILLAAFSYMTVRHEFRMQQRFYVQEAVNKLESLTHQLEEILKDPSDFANSETLIPQMIQIRKRLEAERVDLINPILQTSLLISKTPIAHFLLTQLGESPETNTWTKGAKKSWAGTSQHIGHIQKSLELKRAGTPYHTFIDRKAKKIFGYMPFRNPEKNQLYVAVAQFPLPSFGTAFQNTARLILFMVTMAVLSIMAISLLLTRRIIRPLRSINRACREMLAGQLGKQVVVKTGDELELLASNFNKMSQALQLMTHQAEDSNPLTQLPGNRRIMEEINRRIQEDRKFVFFHVDIDHFKAFNDQYGLSRGDDVIRRTAQLMQTCVNSLEIMEPFVGHQGGDDFILIVEPSKAETSAQEICRQFDQSIREFYTPEDLERGYFLGPDPRAVSLSGEIELTRQPLMSISLAGISNMKSPLKDHQEVLSKSAAVKKKAKKLPYSVFLIEE